MLSFMLAKDWFYTASFGSRSEATSPTIKHPTNPRIEYAGNGWFTVYGDTFGPFDRYGREAAEKALAAIVGK